MVTRPISLFSISALSRLFSAFDSRPLASAWEEDDLKALIYPAPFLKGESLVYFLRRRSIPWLSRRCLDRGCIGLALIGLMPLFSGLVI